LLPETILTWLNLGGDPAGLENLLVERSQTAGPRAVVELDVDRDGRLDLLVSLTTAGSAASIPAGELILYHCRADRAAYRMESVSFTPASKVLASIPVIFAAQDLDADNWPEIVTAQTECDGSSCSKLIHILRWSQGSLVNVLAGDSSDLPNPRITLQEQNDQGVFSLDVTSQPDNQPGVPPQRAVMRRWQPDIPSGLWKAMADVLEPSSYRIHAAIDADSLLHGGKLDEAASLYGRLIRDDPPLTDWTQSPAERLTLAAYANYRLVTLYSLQGQTSETREIIAEMRHLYPRGSLQYGFLILAENYSWVYANTSRDAACSTTQYFAKNHPEMITDLINQYGYGDPGITAEQLCP
jgi:hypothetical protein